MRPTLTSADFEPDVDDDALLDRMRDLPFCETAVEAAAYCLATALRALPSRAALVHLYEVDARAFVVVYAQGPNADRLLLTRTPEADSLITMAMFKHQALVVGYESDSTVAPSERHAFFGDPAAVVVAPVALEGRFLGSLELVDPEGGVADFDVTKQSTLLYVADRFAEFLGKHGVSVGNVVAPPSGGICKLCDAGDRDHECAVRGATKDVAAKTA